MTVAMKRELVEAVLQAQMDEAIRVVVFTGTGRGFCAGDDLQSYTTHEGGTERRMPAIPPGHDSPIASTQARLGSATLRFGLLTDEGGHYLLLQHLGLGQTIDFLMRKRSVSAEEALEPAQLRPDGSGA